MGGQEAPSPLFCEIDLERHVPASLTLREIFLFFDLTLSMGMTFPFNITVGLPLYL